MGYDILIVALCVWNAAVLLVYGADKSRARRGAWRIKEGTLIALAFALGAAGAMLGMILFRHKTRHVKFILLVPLALIINICIFYIGVSF